MLTRGLELCPNIVKVRFKSECFLRKYPYDDKGNVKKYRNEQTGVNQRQKLKKKLKISPT